MIAVIDHGAANLFSLARSLEFLRLDCIITSDKSVISNADKIILPGVGAFGDAMHKLADKGLDSVVIEQAKSGKPLLGICLGMQMLFEESLEFGRNKGLGLLPGVIKPLTGGGIKIPHMGWNNINATKDNQLIKKEEYVYFVHSYYAEISEITIASATYGSNNISAAVGMGNIYGAQFHPEKSGAAGLEILKNFGTL